MIKYHGPIIFSNIPQSGIDFFQREAFISGKFALEK